MTWAFNGPHFLQLYGLNVSLMGLVHSYYDDSVMGLVHSYYDDIVDITPDHLVLLCTSPIL